MTITSAKSVSGRPLSAWPGVPRRGLATLCLALGFAGIATGAHAVQEPLAIVRSLAVQDAAVLRVGERLAVSAAPFCRRPGWSAGMTVQRLSQYRTDLRPIAATVLGLSERPTITHVAAGGAADEAGLRGGDVIAAIDGTIFAERAAGGRKGFDDVQAAHDAIDRALADGRAELTILRSDQRKVVTLNAHPACQVRFDVRAGKSKKDASANGTYVMVSSGLVSFARNDGELAAVLAHELAHHILRHPHRLDAAKGAPRIRDTEIEADRLSVYLMDAAGYPAADSVAFFTRWGPQTDLGVFSDGTHPGWKKRVASIEAEAATIAAMKAAGKPVEPPADLRPVG